MMRILLALLVLVPGSALARSVYDLPTRDPDHYTVYTQCYDDGECFSDVQEDD